MGHINTRSACDVSKSDQIKNLRIDSSLDLCAITETWFSTTYHPKTVSPPGYTVQHIARDNKRGGGVALIYKQSFSSLKLTEHKFTSLECLECLLKLDSNFLRVVVIYRPPGKIPVAQCIEELTSLFDSFLLSPGKLLLTGDLNFHLDILNDPAAKQFSTLLDSFNLEQHVKVATHVKGHTLDPVITRCGELPVLNITVDHSVKSDHFAILFTLPMTAPTKAKVTVSIRKLKAIDIQAFSDSISASKLQQHVRAADNATEAYEFYNTTLREILDDHAPVTQRTITTRSESPWFTTNIKLAKAKRRSLEKQ